jgi:polar amino acid transport system substrate-binding protein
MLFCAIGVEKSMALDDAPLFLSPAPASASVQRPQAIRFVTSDDFPPFNFKDGNGTLTGYNVEVARAICAKLAVPCTIQVRPFPLLVEAVATNAADAIIAGIQDTPALRRHVIHTQAYLRLPARFVVQRGATFKAVPEGLAGRRIAAVANTRPLSFLKDFFGLSLIETAESDEAAFAMLAGGRVDAVFTGALPAAFWLQGPQAKNCCVFAEGAYTESAYFGQGLSIAVAKDNLPLRDVLNDTLRALEAEGVTADLGLRFFPVKLY